MKRLTCKNGLRVANFSSPHAFKFSSGETLDGCAVERAQKLSLEKVEVEKVMHVMRDHDEWEHCRDAPVIEWTDCSVHFRTTLAVRQEIKKIQRDETIDICLIPFPMLTAMKAEGIELGKFRCCQLVDRIKKTIFPNRFSI